MATKKTVVSTKKPTKKAAPVARKSTTTKVTTVKAAQAAAPVRRARFTFMRTSLMSASVAELIGTFLLAAVVLVASAQAIFVMFGVLAVVLAVGAVSGGHFNPALTIGALATRRITAVRAAAYVVAQVLGALLALVVLNGFVSAAPEVSQQAQAFGQASPSLFSVPSIPEGKEWTVLAAELLGTVVLAFGVAAGARGGLNINRALSYAGSLFVALLIAGTAAGYVSAGAVLNPALAASLQALKFELWPILVYVVTPLVGGVLGFALSDVVRSEEAEVVA